MSLAPSAAPPRVDEALLEDLLSRLAASTPGGAECRRMREAAITVGLPLALRLAGRYAGHGEPLEDLRQVAALALVQAVDNYRPGMGPGFVAYAMPTVLGALRRHFRDHAWNIRVTRHLQELRLRIAAAERELTQRLSRPPTPDDLAAELGTSAAEVREALDAARAYRAASLDAPSTAGMTLGDRCGTADAALEAVENLLVLRETLAQLPERLRVVVTLRFGAELTQGEIAARIGVSQMHVSRLLDKALGLLREPFVGGVPAAAEPRRRHRARRSFPAAATGSDAATFGTASAAPHRPEATPRRDSAPTRSTTPTASRRRRAA